MNKDILRAALAILGSKAANYSWQNKYLNLLADTECGGLYTIADECIVKGWQRIAIWKDNAFSRACASCLAQNTALTVVVFDNKKPSDFGALDAGYVFEAVPQPDAIREDFDILFYSDYADYMRRKTVLRRRMGKGNRIWDGLHHLIFHAWCGQVGAYVKQEYKKVNKMQGGGYAMLHLSMPSYGEICKDHSKKVFSTNITAKSLDTLKLLFGYMKKKEDFETACKEFLNQGSWIKKGNLVTVGDYKSTYFNRTHGERRNCYARADADHTIWLVGPCIVLGSYVEDKYTLASLLQKKIDAGGQPFRVRAYATLPYITSIKNMLCYLPVKSGDIVVIITEAALVSQSNPILQERMKHAFTELLKKEDFFIDEPIHCNYRGNEAAVDTLYRYLFVDKINEADRADEAVKAYGEKSQKEAVPKREFYKRSGNPKLDSYLQELSMQRVACSHAGCIVMNCNPFTLGHRYLIEAAAKEVDVLYVFVVEEDSSYFSFHDRLQLVQSGTKDLDNVVVLASGQFILSADTFSEYFHKEDSSVGTVDVSKDLFLFVQYIAPCLKLEKRFAGEEPFDLVTRQYNDGMRDILPQFGMEFVEIPRKKAGGEVISATKVRKYLKDGNWKALRQLVPESTYRFLANKYFKE